MTGYIQDVVSHTTLVRASPERVYDALTTAAGLDSWFTTGSRLDPRTGGEIFFRWVEFGPDRVTTQAHGLVIEAVRPQRFVFQWPPGADINWLTTVEIDLTPRDGGTLISLRESGYPDTPQGLRLMLDCASGWGEALTLLKFFLEHGAHY